MCVFICVRVCPYDIAPMQQQSELLGASFLLPPWAHVCPGDQTQALGSVASALNGWTISIVLECFLGSGVQLRGQDFTL